MRTRWWYASPGALSCESRPAARERDQPELRVGAHRHERRLGVGDQMLGRFLLAKLGGGDGVGKLRGEHVTELARFLGEPCRLGRTGDRLANRAAVDARPRLRTRGTGRAVPAGRRPGIRPRRSEGTEERGCRPRQPSRPDRRPSTGRDRACRPATSRPTRAMTSRPRWTGSMSPSAARRCGSSAGTASRSTNADTCCLVLSSSWSQ